MGSLPQYIYGIGDPYWPVACIHPDGREEIMVHPDMRKSNLPCGERESPDYGYRNDSEDFTWKEPVVREMFLVRDLCKGITETFNTRLEALRQEREHLTDMVEIILREEFEQGSYGNSICYMTDRPQRIIHLLQGLASLDKEITCGVSKLSAEDTEVPEHGQNDPAA